MRLSASVIVVCLVSLCFGPVAALANGFYVPEIGVRAASLGAAFVGLSDDYSAMHYNPAGITQIKGIEVTASLADGMPLASREGAVYFSGPPSNPIYRPSPIQATSSLVHHWAPGVFAYADLATMKVGLGAYTLAEVGAKWSGTEVWDDLIDDYTTTDDVGPRATGIPPNYESSIKGYVVSASLAKEIIPGLSLGVTGHALYSHVRFQNGGWIQEIFDNEAPEPDSSYLHPAQMTEDATGWSYGATFGVLYRATNYLSVGASLRTPMTVTHEGWVEVVSSWEPVARPKQNESFDLTYPMWAAVGFAYRDFLAEGLTITADLQWTQWSDVDSLARTVDNELPGGNTTPMNWENTYEFAIGFDYRVSRSLSLRLGYRNSPTPATDDATYNFILPETDKNVVGLGVGYRQDVWTLDFALSYQLSDVRTIDGIRDPAVVSDPGNQAGKHLEDIIIPSLSFTYRF